MSSTAAAAAAASTKGPMELLPAPPLLQWQRQKTNKNSQNHTATPGCNSAIDSLAGATHHRISQLININEQRTTASHSLSTSTSNAPPHLTAYQHQRATHHRISQLININEQRTTASHSLSTSTSNAPPHLTAYQHQRATHHRISQLININEQRTTAYPLDSHLQQYHSGERRTSAWLSLGFH